MRAKGIKTFLLPRYLGVDPQKEHGVVYTPSEIVQLIYAEVGYREEVLEGGWLLDPACGEGAFLEEEVRLLIEAAQAQEWPEEAIVQALETRIWGVDIDGAALYRAKEKLTALARSYGLKDIRWNLHQANALDPFWIAPLRGRFRWVLGNPPYVRIQHLGAARRQFLIIALPILSKGQYRPLHSVF